MVFRCPMFKHNRVNATICVYLHVSFTTSRPTFIVEDFLYHVMLLFIAQNAISIVRVLV